MNPNDAQQVALDNALVAPENRVKIRICNMRIDPTKTPKEPNYQVVLDALALSPLDPSFLITAEIYSRLPNQEFVVPPSFDSKIISFIKELGYTYDIDSVTKVYTDHMHQPWRTFAAVINTCLSRKTTCLDKIRLSSAQILDTPGASVSKKKAPAKTKRSKGIELLSEAAVPDVSKADTSKSENESWGDSDDDAQQGGDERTESNNDKDDDLNKIDDEEEDECVHTPDDYVPNDDKNIDDEEYDRINKEMYSDVNVKLKDIELEGKGKDDKEMTNFDHVDAEHENVNQEVAGDQVKDVDQETIIAAPATQKTEVPLQSSFISSEYATRFLNFDNIPLADTKIISMIDIKVQHEDPSSQTSPLLTVPVLVLLEFLTAPAITIPSPIPPFIHLPQ
nr:hypothetical protein [Tanacetum cinerariifolium]